MSLNIIVESRILPNSMSTAPATPWPPGAPSLHKGNIALDTIRDTLVLSVTSFHGRGVQPPGLKLTDTLTTLAGLEAVFGLLIEGLFIAAFTRRVTGG